MKTSNYHYYQSTKQSGLIMFAIKNVLMLYDCHKNELMTLKTIPIDEDKITDSNNDSDLINFSNLQIFQITKEWFLLQARWYYKYNRGGKMEVVYEYFNYLI